MNKAYNKSNTEYTMQYINRINPIPALKKTQIKTYEGAKGYLTISQNFAEQIFFLHIFMLSCSDTLLMLTRLRN